jgi:hypothetical protein
MKVIARTFSILLLLILAVSCAATPRVLPAKYDLGDYLEEVDQISTFRISGYEAVDYQSVILRTTFKAIRTDYYLLVLDRPMNIRYSNERLIIENTASKDKDYSAQSILSEIRDSSHGIPDGTEFRQAPSNITNIVTGTCRVFVRPSGDPEGYVIEKIYKLAGKEQVKEIKERILES